MDRRDLILELCREAGVTGPEDEIVEEWEANYHTNLKRYPEWHSYFHEHQPLTLVVWGKNDPLFGPEGATAYQRDLKNIEVHMLDTGHFALEEDCDVIAAYIRSFMDKNLSSAQ